MLDTLMCASSSSASKRLWSCTRFRVILLRSRCAKPLLGHEAQGQLLGDQRFTTALHPGSPSCGLRAAIHCAWAR